MLGFEDLSSSIVAIPHGSVGRVEIRLRGIEVEVLELVFSNVRVLANENLGGATLALEARVEIVIDLPAQGSAN